MAWDQKMTLIILKPSNGGKGIKLKTAILILSIALRVQNCINIFGPIWFIVKYSEAIVAIIKDTRAIIIFDSGHAIAIVNSPQRGFLRYDGLNITGLHRPKLVRNKHNNHHGSMWTKGLILNLHCIFGVGSPNWVAVQACANSWMVIEYTIMIGKKI